MIWSINGESIGKGTGSIVGGTDFEGTFEEAQQYVYNSRPIEDFKTDKIKELKEYKNDIIATCKVSATEYFQADDISLVTMESRFTYLLNISDLTYSSTSFLHIWRCGDDCLYTFTNRADAISILNNVISKARENWGVYNDKTQEIKELTTVQEVVDYDLTTDWTTMDIT